MFRDVQSPVLMPGLVCGLLFVRLGSDSKAFRIIIVKKSLKSSKKINFETTDIGTLYLLNNLFNITYDHSHKYEKYWRIISLYGHFKISNVTKELLDFTFCAVFFK